jgi:phosphate transport system substrate-binding protein
VGVIPGIQEYLNEFTAESTWGPDGYLSDKGLIPMPDKERQQFQSDVKALTPLTMQ